MLIDSEKLKQDIATVMPSRIEVNLIVDAQQEAIVRCKDCVYWKPPHIRLNDGKQRAYKESDREGDPFGMLSVSMDVGINVGGKCWVDHNTGYSEDKRVFRRKNDFCGKARKLPDGETNESWWGLSEEPSELIDD